MTLRRTASIAAGVALVMGALEARGQPSPPLGPDQDKPNAVLIIIDELGYPFVGANGGLTAKGVSFSTPHIDRLAETGIHNGSHPTVMKSELSGFYEGVPKVEMAALEPCPPHSLP